MIRVIKLAHSYELHFICTPPWITTIVIQVGEFLYNKGQRWISYHFTMKGAPQSKTEVRNGHFSRPNLHKSVSMPLF